MTRPVRPGLAGPRERLPLELRDQGSECAVEDLGQIPGGDPVAQQRLGVLQPVVGLLSDSELQGEALRRQRRHLRSRFGSPDLRRRKFAGE